MARFAVVERGGWAAVTVALAVCGLGAGTVFGRGNQAVLGYDDIAKVMEKLPPQMVLLSSPDTTNWACQDVDLTEYCTDLDGCTVALHMQHKIDGNDMVRGINEHLYLENATTSADKGRGVNGYTRQSGGGEYGWITGSTGQYTLFNPWGWMGAYNYRPAQCPGQNGRNSPAHADPYLMTVATHPHVNTVLILED